MNKPIVVIYDIENLLFGTKVRIVLNKTTFVKAISFGDKFGLQTGEVKIAREIKEKGWKIILGWE